MIITCFPRFPGILSGRKFNETRKLYQTENEMPKFYTGFITADVPLRSPVDIITREMHQL